MESSFSNLEAARSTSWAVRPASMRHTAAKWRTTTLKLSKPVNMCPTTTIQTRITNLSTTWMRITVAHLPMILTDMATLTTMPGNGTVTITTRGSLSEDSHMANTRTNGLRSTGQMTTILTVKCCLLRLESDTANKIRCNITRKCQAIREPITGMGSLVTTGTNLSNPRGTRLTGEDTGTDKMEMQLTADTFTIQETTIDEN